MELFFCRDNVAIRTISLRVARNCAVDFLKRYVFSTEETLLLCEDLEETCPHY